MFAYLHTFKATNAYTRFNNQGVFVPRQIYLTDGMVWAILKTFPTCFAFSGVKLNKRCLYMFVVKRFWFHITITPNLFRLDTKLDSLIIFSRILI